MPANALEPILYHGHVRRPHVGELIDKPVFTHRYKIKDVGAVPCNYAVAIQVETLVVFCSCLIYSELEKAIVIESVFSVYEFYWRARQLLCTYDDILATDFCSISLMVDTRNSVICGVTVYYINQGAFNHVYGGITNGASGTPGLLQAGYTALTK